MSESKLDNEIKNLKLPLVNIRRTSNLAIAPINNFGMALGFFMLSVSLTKWCKFETPITSAVLIFGGVCEYILGILDWYQGKTILCFIDFIFSFLHAFIYYCFKYQIDEGDNYKFESYLLGTFFVLYLVILCCLTFICLEKGILYLACMGLLVFADIFVIVWQYRYKKGNGEDKHNKRIKKVAGYFLFFASLAIWASGVGKFINEMFQQAYVPNFLLKPEI